ncbi:Protein of unknown function [Cohnella sp. OV330]|uniref:DUF3102 domain-containing protein n=1 Tax=Cohnella sp. OV330 TaxID=1855288 RepID=UPI0008E42C7F|nr:DUF3102 domain-containing protein [Cohnella sp. OV330]SFB62690.1 Protein of unknown function [Cohnella sp. OV330]
MTQQVAELRTIETITSEINIITEQTRNYVLHSAIQVGERLIEAKGQLKHGEWGKWLADSVNYSQSKAQNLMKLATEYGGKTQALGNIGVTQAVALLALPEEDREQFAVEVDIENISTRDLEKAIKEREEAQRLAKEAQEKEAAERKAREKLEQANEQLAAKSKQHEELAEKMKADLELALAAKDDKSAEKAKADLQKSKDALAEAKAKVKELEAQLKSKPIDVPKVEVKEVIPEAMKLEMEELKRQVIEQQQQLAKNDNKYAIRFEICFNVLISDFNDLLSVIEEVGKENPEEAAKYRDGVKKTIDKMKGKL